jgi:hypothetical protein
VVILHIEVIAVVVQRYTSIYVMRGIDIDLALENMRGGIGGIEMGDQWLRNGPAG